jgi:hypothetical protein
LSFHSLSGTFKFVFDIYRNFSAGVNQTASFRQGGSRSQDMKGRYFASICLLLPIFLIGLSASTIPQTPAGKPGSFPDSLLAGVPKFDLAILLQGDLRGNFGPCG